MYSVSYTIRLTLELFNIKQIDRVSPNFFQIDCWYFQVHAIVMEWAMYRMLTWGDANTKEVFAFNNPIDEKFTDYPFMYFNM